MEISGAANVQPAQSLVSQEVSKAAQVEITAKEVDQEAAQVAASSESGSSGGGVDTYA